MSIPLERSEIRTLRIALGIGGLLTLIAGILILVWPIRVAMVATAIVAIYAIATGLAYAGLGFFSRQRGGWSRIGHVVLGLAFIAAGVIAFVNLGAATGFFATFLGLMVGIMWFIEGVVALSTLSLVSSKGWTVFYAIISILAGISLVISPMFGAAVLWWLLGISAVALGIVQLGRAFSLGR